MQHMADYKLHKYNDERLQAICNKFVNNYFYTVGGIEFGRHNPPTNFVKPKYDKDILRELQELGIQTINEQKQAY